MSTEYYPRHIDKSLLEWAKKEVHKPLLLRGARQVGKSTAVRHLGENFDSFIEINFERQPEYKKVFLRDRDPHRIIREISALCGASIQPGKTLLFLDEIQGCHEAIMSLRFFKEEVPELHVIGAGSLLEFALTELPTFGVGRIHSLFMYPMTFDEFLTASGEHLLMDQRNKATAENPLSQVLYEKLIYLFRTYILVGGMPEVVASWVRKHDFLHCQEVQEDLLLSYEDDFAKYSKKANPELLRKVLRSVAVQSGSRFVYSAVGDYRSEEIKNALELLTLAGICVPVYKSSANGLPLGAEADGKDRKILLLDSGLMLRLLHFTLDDISNLITLILNGELADLVNKGPMAEMIAGLEIMRYNSTNVREGLYYWRRDSKNSLSEIDYIIPSKGHILPIEVKAGVRGGMKSMWIFMREKNLTRGVRCSLENFGTFEYIDSQDNGASRDVVICPLFAISQLKRLL